MTIGEFQVPYYVLLAVLFWIACLPYIIWGRYSVQVHVHKSHRRTEVLLRVLPRLSSFLLAFSFLPFLHNTAAASHMETWSLIVAIMAVIGFGVCFTIVLKVFGRGISEMFIPKTILDNRVDSVYKKTR